MIQPSARPRLATLIPLLVALLGLALQLLDPPVLATLRLAMFDQYQRWRPRTEVPAPVRVIDIDEASLARQGQWPWPRTRVAELTERVRAAGAVAIGWDFLFAEADRSSPRQVVAHWPLPAALRTALLAQADHDDVLARTLAAGRIVLGSGLERGAGGAESANAPAPPADAARFVMAGDIAMTRLHRFDRHSRPLPMLQAAAAGVGAMNFLPDHDGIVRRVPLVLTDNGRPVPSLAAEMLRVSQGATNILLRGEGDGGDLAAVRIGALEIPVDARGEAWVHFAPVSRRQHIPAWRVMTGEYPKAQLAGSLVLIGTSAPGLLDTRFSPLGGVMPGVDIHAQALEQILAGDPLRRPWWAPAAEALALALATLAVGLTARLAGATASSVAAVVGIAVIAGGSWFGFVRHGLLLDATLPVLATAAAFVLAGIAHHRDSERRQRWVREAFSRYVSPNRVEHLVEHPDSLQLGGERRQCSFVFSDVADFTQLMESLDPAEAVALLSDYLDGMIGIAFRHEGTLDRVVGDAIAIMFSAPVTQPDHRQRALDCALAMQAHANAHRARLAASGVDFGMTRIGVHCGEVIVGNLGGKAIFDYRALGDPVNTTSRLETANKHLGTQLCVSQDVIEGCADVPRRPIGRLLLKGKHEPVMAWEPMSQAWDGAPRDAEADAAYRAAWALLGENDSAAQSAFAALATRCPDDGLAVFHAHRLARGERGSLIVLDEK